MKRFSMLYCREFSFRVWQVWLLGLAALGSQPLLFSFSELWSGRRFEQAYDGSGAPAAAVILVGLAVGWMVYSTLRDFRGGIDTLLTLPARRGWVYLAKMAAFASMLLVLWAGLLGGVFLSYGWYLLQIGRRLGPWPTVNGLLLAFCRSGVLRLFFPPDAAGIFSNLLMLDGTGRRKLLCRLFHCGKTGLAADSVGHSRALLGAGFPRQIGKCC